MYLKLHLLEKIILYIYKSYANYISRKFKEINSIKKKIY
jgi:hypothetical protein